MREFIHNDMLIQREYYGRFEDLVRAYIIDPDKNPSLRFLGKYIVGSNATEDDIINLFTKGRNK